MATRSKSRRATGQCACTFTTTIHAMVARAAPSWDCRPTRPAPSPRSSSAPPTSPTKEGRPLPRELWQRPLDDLLAADVQRADQRIADNLRSARDLMDKAFGAAMTSGTAIASSTFWRDLIRRCPECHADLLVDAADVVRCGACAYVVPLRKVEMGEDDDAE